MDEKTWKKLLVLFQTNDMCLRILKVFQYASVVISEYALVRYLNLVTKNRLHRPQVADWSDRFKKLGSSLSVLRMALRMFTVLSIIKFVTTYKRKEDQPVPALKWVKTISDALSCILDNWFYLGRVGVYRWATSQEEYLVSQSNTFFALISLTLDLINELTHIHAKNAIEYVKSKASWFTVKLLDYPDLQVYFFYADCTSIKKGDAHFISMISPLILLYKHFAD